TLVRLRGAGYPVPLAVACEETRSPFGRPLLVMERIRGVPLAGSYWAPTPDRSNELQQLFWRLMAALHALDARAIFPTSSLADPRDPYCFVEQEVAFLAALLTRLDATAPPSLRRTLDWLQDRRDAASCGRFAPLHGDFHANNVLRRDDGAAYVIDWSNARAGD